MNKNYLLKNNTVKSRLLLESMTFVVAISLYSCVFDNDSYHKSIEFRNNSDKTIYVGWGFSRDNLYLPLDEPKSNPSNVITPNRWNVYSTIKQTTI